MYSTELNWIKHKKTRKKWLKKYNKNIAVWLFCLLVLLYCLFGCNFACVCLCLFCFRLNNFLYFFFLLFSILVYFFFVISIQTWNSPNNIKKYNIKTVGLGQINRIFIMWDRQNETDYFWWFCCFISFAAPFSVAIVMLKKERDVGAFQGNFTSKTFFSCCLKTNLPLDPGAGEKLESDYWTFSFLKV